MGTLATGTDQAPLERQRSARGEGDKLRSDLLDAAAALMAAHGTIDGISLRAVARRAGVSPTAVYRHFDDHLDLLRESIVQCWKNFDAVMVEAARCSDDPIDAFRAAVDAYVRFATEHQGRYRILFSNRIHLDMTAVGLPNSMTSPGGTGETGMPAFQVLLGLVAGILERNDDERDPFFVTVQAYTWIHGTVDLVGCHPDAPWPEMASLLDGLIASLQLDPS